MVKKFLIHLTKILLNRKGFASLKTNISIMKSYKSHTACSIIVFFLDCEKSIEIHKMIFLNHETTPLNSVHSSKF